MIKNITFFSALAFPLFVFASGGGHESAAEGHAEIPLTEIGWQAANLGILLIALFFLIKGAVVEAFRKRKAAFVEQSEKTRASLLAAEAALSDVRSKLSLLESGEKSSIERAIHDAATMKTSLLKEAELQAQKLKEDSRLVVNAEVEKAKAEIGTIIMKGAIAATSQKISDKKAQITKDSEVEFLRQIGQVKPS